MYELLVDFLPPCNIVEGFIERSNTLMKWKIVNIYINISSRFNHYLILEGRFSSLVFVGENTSIVNGTNLMNFTLVFRSYSLLVTGTHTTKLYLGLPGYVMEMVLKYLLFSPGRKNTIIIE